MRLESFTATDKGKIRPRNEDFFCSSATDNVWLVCDGMGGGAAGELASKITATAVVAYLKAPYDPATAPLRPFYDSRLPQKFTVFAEAIQLANRTLFELSAKYHQLGGMGTTVAGIIFDGTCACVSHIGDSRVYVMRSGRLQRLTKDHSLVMELLEDREISRKEAAKFKQKNVITRALGVQASCDVDLHFVPLDGDITHFLICTDGLWSVVSDAEIEAELKASGDSPANVCAALIAQANAKGGPDNITVSVIRIADHGPAESRRPAEKGALTVTNRSREFFRAQDRVINRLLPAAAAMLPDEVKREYRREVTKTGLLYAAFIVFVTGLLALAGIKIAQMGNQGETATDAGNIGLSRP